MQKTGQAGGLECNRRMGVGGGVVHEGEVTGVIRRECFGNCGGWVVFSVCVLAMSDKRDGCCTAAGSRLQETKHRAQTSEGF